MVLGSVDSAGTVSSFLSSMIGEIHITFSVEDNNGRLPGHVLSKGIGYGK